MESLTEKIIDCVQNHSILYDCTHPEYKNVKKKDKIWYQIGLELHEKGEDIKKKWRNMRDTYAKHLKGINNKTGRPKKNYNHWQWAKHMAVFRPYFEISHTDPNIRVKEEEITMQNQVRKVGHKREFSRDEEIDSSLVFNKPPSDTQLITNLPSYKQSGDNATKKYKRIHDGKTANDLIFSGYAKTVNSFSLKQQSITRMKIAQVVAEQELQHIEELEAVSRTFAKCK